MVPILALVIYGFCTGAEGLMTPLSATAKCAAPIPSAVSHIHAIRVFGYELFVY